MEGNLVIVESPAKAKTIQKFLGKDFVVKSSFGHIRDLQEKSLSVDIENGFQPEYVIPADKKHVVSELKNAAKGVTVWLASDEDREGEAISWHLAEVLGLDPARTNRIVFHEITKPAIMHAIENPRNIDMGLVNAQQARRVLDRLVGFELSPVLWRKIQKGLSAGRVQSVALRLVVDKEREIMSFRSEASYRIDAEFQLGTTTAKATLNTRFNNIDEARRFLEGSIDAHYTVDSIDKKEGVRNPAPPFTTSTLQQEAAKKLRFPVGVTMRVAQSLYERGLITYMRTDSTNLSSLAVNTAREFIRDNYGERYSHTRQYKTNSKGAQEAHEAIRPTYISNTAIDGTEQEKKLYSLIWKRTVASQMESAKLLNTNISVNSDKRPELFLIQGTEIMFDGFLKVYGAGDEGDSAESQILPEFHKGDCLEAGKIEALCKYSQPPYRYTEGTLVKKLEELGIGRPSTYAPTISTLTTGRGYIVKGDKEGTKMQVVNLTLKDGRISEQKKTETVGAEKGRLLPQDIGMIVTDFLTGNFSGIMDFDFTANVEKDFDDIAEGGKEWNEVISGFYGPFHQKVEETLNDRQYNHVEKEIGTDPSDGKVITARFGQYGPYVQKGEGADRQYASLAKGQLIETLTIEEAVKLFQLPRTVGRRDGIDIIVTKGKFGPYLKYGDKNVSLPKGADPMSIDLESCLAIIDAAQEKQAPQVIKEFSASDISVINGRYGPYIKQAGSNYKIPKGTDAESLTEEDCLKIIGESTPTTRKFKRFKKK